ncbi:MAG: RNA polymerase factor sigma-54 [Azospirillum sp.]|nr:RNA polymerase factor sigma-54 [Azospirillum sp.]
MALSQRLDLRQSQSLVMTPQLQQAIKLLQLSNLELSDFIDREIEQNPLLEREDSEPYSNGEIDPKQSADFTPAEPVSAVAEADLGVRDCHDLAMSDVLPTGAEAPLDTDFENVWTNGSAVDEPGEGGGEAFGQWSGQGGRSGFDDDDPNLEQTLSGATTLRDHLIGQLNCDIGDAGDRLIGLALIDLLDEAGYLSTDLATVAELLSCEVERVQAVLKALQRFDPSGVFARSLSECLAIQLRERNRLDPAMQALLDHLDLLAARNLPALIRVCGVDAEDLAEMVGEIRALDPKPALAFDHTPAQLVTPDILMRPAQGGGWIIDLNPDTLPRVLINHRYFTRVSGEVRKKAEKDYLTERFNSANWLVKSLHQRATTILKVASEIVRQQDAFFIHGIQHLKPLILRNIAEAIGMHESTVSRVTTNKFMATSRGVFELKYFFTSAIPGADGHANHSAEAVRFRIKALIDDEPADAVLSDDRIVEILRADGIEIARRTVAKYREAMRIPSSVQRRREKSMKL